MLLGGALGCLSSLEAEPRLAGQSWPRKSGLVGFTTQAHPDSVAASTRLVLGKVLAEIITKDPSIPASSGESSKLPISRVTRLFQVRLLLGSPLSLWLDSDFLTCTVFNGRRMGCQTLWFSIWNTEHFTVFCFKITFILFPSMKFRPYPSTVLGNLAKAPSLCSSPELSFIRMSTPFIWKMQLLRFVYRAWFICRRGGSDCPFSIIWYKVIVDILQQKGNSSTKHAISPLQHSSHKWTNASHLHISTHLQPLLSSAVSKPNLDHTVWKRYNC